MAVSIVLMVYHIFYNNLAYNWRFSVKIASYPCGTYFCFDPWNWLLCFCFLKKPCQDRCCTSWTAVKWTLFFPAFAYLAYTVNSWKNAKDLQFETEGIYEELGKEKSDYLREKYMTNLDILYTIFAL